MWINQFQRDCRYALQLLRLVLLSLAGIAAIPTTFLLLNVLSSLLPNIPVPVLLDLSVTARGLTVAAGVTLCAGVVHGLAPIRYALRLNVANMLHGQSSTASGDRMRMRHLLIAGQVAVSLMLAIVAGLFIRTLNGVQAVGHGSRIPLVAGACTLDTIRTVDGRILSRSPISSAGWDVVSPEYLMRLG